MTSAHQQRAICLHYKKSLNPAIDVKWYRTKISPTKKTAISHLTLLRAALVDHNTNMTTPQHEVCHAGGFAPL